MQFLADRGLSVRRAEEPGNSNVGTVLAVEPARLGAAAQLLLDTPTLKAAVSLLTLSASFQRQAGTEQTLLEPPAAS